MRKPSEKKKILIVEDEPSLQNALHNKLLSAGYTVIVAKNAEEGWELLQQDIDLIILDIRLPGEEDGFDLLKKIREHSEYNSVEVIILTNDTSPQAAVDAWTEKVAKFLIKTEWSLQEIVELIDQTLGIIREENT